MKVSICIAAFALAIWAALLDFTSAVEIQNESGSGDNIEVKK